MLLGVQNIHIFDHTAAMTAALIIVHAVLIEYAISSSVIVDVLSLRSPESSIY